MEESRMPWLFTRKNPHWWHAWSMAFTTAPLPFSSPWISPLVLDSEFSVTLVGFDTFDNLAIAHIYRTHNNQWQVLWHNSIPNKSYPISYQEALHTINLDVPLWEIVNHVVMEGKQDTPGPKVDMNARLNAWLETKAKNNYKATKLVSPSVGRFLSPLSSRQIPVDQCQLLLLMFLQYATSGIHSLRMVSSVPGLAMLTWLGTGWSREWTKHRTA